MTTNNRQNLDKPGQSHKAVVDQHDDSSGEKHTNQALNLTQLARHSQPEPGSLHPKTGTSRATLDLGGHDRLYHSVTSADKQPRLKHAPIEQSAPDKKRLEVTDKTVEPRVNHAQKGPRDANAPVRLEDFATVGKSVLHKLSPDGTPVTKEQLAKALQNPGFKGQEAQAVAALYRSFDGLHDLSNHQWFWQADSVTPRDLDRFSANNKHLVQHKEMSFNVKQWLDGGNIKKLTGDPGGIVYAGDIERALKNPKLSKNDQKALKDFQNVFDDASQHHGFFLGEKGVKVSDIEAYNKRLLFDGPEARLAKEMSIVIQRTSSAQHNVDKPRLYATDNPLASITPDAIRQGRIGNCYFESALAGIASANPAIIRDSIKDNRNGTYTVTFKGAKDEPITVKAPTVQEMGVYNGGTRQGIWANVVEKAYGQYRDNHDDKITAMPQDAADGGGEAGRVLEFLTGRKTSAAFFPDKTPQSRAAVLKEMEASFTGPHPRAMVANTMTYSGKDAARLKLSEGNTQDGYSQSHAFTVTNFKPDGKGGGTVSLRNPWGGKDGTGGKSQISLDKFVKNFRILWSVPT